MLTLTIYAPVSMGDNLKQLIEFTISNETANNLELESGSWHMFESYKLLELNENAKVGIPELVKVAGWMEIELIDSVIVLAS